MSFSVIALSIGSPPKYSTQKKYRARTDVPKKYRAIVQKLWTTGKDRAALGG
jgi:hypothetical protein